MSLLFSRKHRRYEKVARVKTRLAWKVCAMEPKTAVRQVCVTVSPALAMSHWSGWEGIAGHSSAHFDSEVGNVH